MRQAPCHTPINIIDIAAAYDIPITTWQPTIYNIGLYLSHLGSDSALDIRMGFETTGRCEGHSFEI